MDRNPRWSTKNGRLQQLAKDCVYGASVDLAPIKEKIAVTFSNPRPLTSYILVATLRQIEAPDLVVIRCMGIIHMHSCIYQMGSGKIPCSSWCQQESSCRRRQTITTVIDIPLSIADLPATISVSQNFTPRSLQICTSLFMLT